MCAWTFACVFVLNRRSNIYTPLFALNKLKIEVVELRRKVVYNNGTIRIIISMSCPILSWESLSSSPVTIIKQIHTFYQVQSLQLLCRRTEYFFVRCILLHQAAMPQRSSLKKHDQTALHSAAFIAAALKDVR